MALEYKKSNNPTDCSKPNGETVSLAASEVVQLRFPREPFRRRELRAAMSAPRNDCDVILAPAETRRLLGVCIELIDICSKVTGKIDPAVGTLIAYARDEAIAAFETSS